MSTETTSSAKNVGNDSSAKPKDTSVETGNWKPDSDEEWNRREQSRRVDKEYVDRRMPYNDKPKRGWWE